MKKNILFFIVISITVMFSAYVSKIVFEYLRTENDRQFYKNIEEIRIAFIKSLPIYDDFANPAMELILRKHLISNHIAASKRLNEKQIQNDSEIHDFIKSGLLVSLEPAGLYFFHNVQKNYRYLHPAGKKGLELITRRFQENIRKRGDLPVVKIAVSSALRPISYNTSKMKKNLNVSPYSTHSYGTSFDIFYDEFFVDISDDNLISDEGRRRMGFLMGGYLRRQFKAILMETLLQLQDEGFIYVILEINQRCYHITPLKTD